MYATSRSDAVARFASCPRLPSCRLPSGEKYRDEWSYTPLGAWAAFENDLIPYIYSSGNRNAAYLRTDGVTPLSFRLLSEWAE